MSTSGRNHHHALWLKLITKSYGSLENFTDRRTVLHMQAMLLDDLAETSKIEGSLDADGLKEWNEVFSKDKAQRETYIAELTAWLETPR